MEDLLTRFRACVEDDPVAALRDLPFGRDRPRLGQDPPQQDPPVFRQIVERRDVFLGDDEDMDGGLGVDVLEGQDLLIFVIRAGISLLMILQKMQPSIIPPLQFRIRSMEAPSPCSFSSILS